MLASVNLNVFVGADIELESVDGCAAVHAALESGHASVVRLLHAQGNLYKYFHQHSDSSSPSLNVWNIHIQGVA